MPLSFIYILVMLAIICLWFLLFKRPIYEAIFIAFIALVAITGTWGNLLEYVNSGLKTSLLYSMVVFTAMSILLTKTKIIDGAVSIILALLGRIPGGAGYVSVLSSAFMGALSGSGPGNVMATGTLTIPAMKKSGFPAELAGNIESTSSYLGNMIPPSANIVAALGAFVALYPEYEMTTGQFWIACWGCSIWFILQRLLTVFAFCKYYKVKAMAKEDIPSIKETLKTGWQGLLLPVIILLPFILDFLFKSTLFTDRLGATGASYMSSSILYFIAGVASIYAVIATKDKKAVTPHAIAKMFAKGIKTISPTVAACIFGYMVGSLFNDLNIAVELETVLSGLNMSLVGLAFIIPLFACFITMVIPGSSTIVIFGSVFISLFATAGANPVMVAAMLPCICGVMCGITPPFALGMYAGMSLSGAEFGKTFKNNLWWVALQYILEVVILLGWLPILGV